MSKKIDSIIFLGLNGDMYSTDLTGKEIKKWEDKGSSAFDYSVVCNQIKRLLGQVLTVIDASYTNERQLKAIKDIVRNHFSNELSYLWKVSENDWEKIIEDSFEDSIKNGTLQEATLEEVLGA